MSAVPALVHQLAAVNLLVRLWNAAPPGFLVLPAPFAVALAPDTELQPDIVVGRVEDYGEQEITAPALVVDVLSPSTRFYDLNTKLRRFERAGTPSFWVVDPVARPADASLVAWELGPDGAYREVVKATGEDAAGLTRPFPVTVVPADLVRVPRGRSTGV